MLEIFIDLTLLRTSDRGLTRFNESTALSVF